MATAVLCGVYRAYLPGYARTVVELLSRTLVRPMTRLCWSLWLLVRRMLCHLPCLLGAVIGGLTTGAAFVGAACAFSDGSCSVSANVSGFMVYYAVGAVPGVPLLAPDAYLAFGLLFLAGAIGWSSARYLHARSPGGAAARGAALMLPAALVVTLMMPATALAQNTVYAPGRMLTEALDRYRALAAGPDLRPPPSRRIVRSGDVFAAADTLRRYLIMLGDVTDTLVSGVGAEADTIYDDDLVQGVIAFQVRHGLEPDGIIGPATMAAMRVPLSQRVHQLEVALERWRQLPDTVPERVVVVNVPAFRLYAFERDAGTGRPVLRMNVIVGRAQGRHATPLFSGVMRELVFQPYWDVPPSIARAELLPAIRRDPGYLAREHLEIVRGGDHDAAIYRPTAANLSRVAAGDLRLRQRPGPWNSLGAVKFVFPNRYNVYLHGTPAQGLFARARRDFSHGCIRIENPAALAEWVLDGQEGWDGSAIAAAMTTGMKSRRVPLARPVPVYMLYATAVVGDDGLVRFYPDIYGHDGARSEQ